MAATLATYIALPGTTEEAMKHWQEVFGGELHIDFYGAETIAAMGFTPPENAVAHATLTLPAGIIAGSDAIDGEEYPVKGSAYSLLYSVDTPDEAKVLIGKLIEGGGSAGMPFENAPWGGWYGQVFDRFGVMWSFSCENN